MKHPVVVDKWRRYSRQGRQEVEEPGRRGLQKGGGGRQGEDTGGGNRRGGGGNRNGVNSEGKV